MKIDQEVLLTTLTSWRFLSLSNTSKVRGVLMKSLVLPNATSPCIHNREIVQLLHTYAIQNLKEVSPYSDLQSCTHGELDQVPSTL